MVDGGSGDGNRGDGWGIDCARCGDGADTTGAPGSGRGRGSKPGESDTAVVPPDSADAAVRARARSPPRLVTALYGASIATWYCPWSDS